MSEECVHEEQTTEMTRTQLAAVIACETGGFTTAMPEQDDFDLADEFIARIKNRYN